jgi:hypothetical protein
MRQDRRPFPDQWGLDEEQHQQISESVTEKDAKGLKRN